MFGASLVLRFISGSGHSSLVPTINAAHAYIEKANSKIEREFFIIQEFTYPTRGIVDEAKIILRCKSDSFIIMEEGKTERRAGIWADVRTFSVCDKATASDYVRRFNEDAKAAHEVRRKA